ncbi:MAG: hypothetical protein LBN32_02235 [Helicobacteraceae bacterium]|jgi:hypothetical protein|nr:hypothetical protein [Helicobacteraceae bacterium]
MVLDDRKTVGHIFSDKIAILVKYESDRVRNNGEKGIFELLRGKGKVKRLTADMPNVLQDTKATKR